MGRRSGIEEIIGGIIGIMVLVSVVSVLFADLNISSVINKSFFSLLILAMFIALIIKIVDVLRDYF